MREPETGHPAVPLDIHRERATTAARKAAQRVWARGCERPQPGVFWRTWEGELLPVRCGASNRCLYCSMLAARETALVIKLDALEGERRPSWGLTTTTARPGYEWKALKDAETKLWRQLRREHGDVQYVGFVEWTTGRAHTSGGHRRPHIHHLVKGLPRTLDAAAFTAELSRKWRTYTADAWQVDARPLRTPAGAIAYFVHHHEKTVQGPPPGTRHVKRVRPSRGYFDKRLPILRAEARSIMADERTARDVLDALDAPEVLTDDLWEALLPRIDAARALAEERKPTLVRQTPSGYVAVDRTAGKVAG